MSRDQEVRISALEQELAAAEAQIVAVKQLCFDVADTFESDTGMRAGEDRLLLTVPEVLACIGETL